MVQQDSVVVSQPLPNSRREMEEPIEMVNCPLCDAAIDVDEEELDEGDVLICEE